MWNTSSRWCPMWTTTRPCTTRNWARRASTSTARRSRRSDRSESLGRSRADAFLQFSPLRERLGRIVLDLLFAVVAADKYRFALEPDLGGWAHCPQPRVRHDGTIALLLGES